jgi:hypothetical protein
MDSNIWSQLKDQLHDKLQAWSIFFVSDFLFEKTGEKRDKYSIILSNNSMFYAILICYTTSKVDKYVEILTEDDYVFIPQNTWPFNKNTLILIQNSNIHTIERDQFLNLTTNYLWMLDKDIFQEVIEKFKLSDRISNFTKWLL